MWLTSTKMLAPSSTGCAASPWASTVVLRPPMYEDCSKMVMLVGIEADAAKRRRW
jgi:hypothetical protein